MLVELDEGDPFIDVKFMNMFKVYYNCATDHSRGAIGVNEAIE